MMFYGILLPRTVAQHARCRDIRATVSAANDRKPRGDDETRPSRWNSGIYGLLRTAGGPKASTLMFVRDITFPRRRSNRKLPRNLRAALEPLPFPYLRRPSISASRVLDEDASFAIVTKTSGRRDRSRGATFSPWTRLTVFEDVDVSSGLDAKGNDGSRDIAEENGAVGWP